MFEEKLFDDDPFAENRILKKLAKDKYNKYLSLEDSYLKQKFGYDWLKVVTKTLDILIVL